MKSPRLALVLVLLALSACAPLHPIVTPPPPPVPITLNLGVSGPDPSTVSVLVTPDGHAPVTGHFDTANRFIVPLPFEDAGIGASITIAAPHYLSVTMRLSDDTCKPVAIWFSGPHELCSVTLKLARPTAEARAPLPPDPPGTYDHLLTQTVPPSPDLRWMRANVFDMVVPGLPFVYQGSSEHPERALTPFIDRYSDVDQQRMLDQYARRGYTHFWRWLPDSRQAGGIDSHGQSLAAYVATSVKIHQAGFYVCHSLISKTWDPRDADGAYYQTVLDPWLDALIAADAIQCATVGFELDLFNEPGRKLQSIIDYVTAKLVPHGIPVYVHFSPEKTWWGAADFLPNRFAWWDHQSGKLTGLLYQFDPAWTIAEAQARMADTLRQFANTDSGFGHPFDDVAFETKAAIAFSADQPDEDQIDLFDSLLLDTQGGVAPYGFGNGARRLDGSVF